IVTRLRFCFLPPSGMGLQACALAGKNAYSTRGIGLQACALQVGRQQPHDQGRPAGLVIRAAAPAVVPVEIFEEPDEIAPVWIFIENAHIALPRAAAALVG